MTPIYQLRAEVVRNSTISYGLFPPTRLQELQYWAWKMWSGRLPCIRGHFFVILQSLHHPYLIVNLILYITWFQNAFVRLLTNEKHSYHDKTTGAKNFKKIFWLTNIKRNFFKKKTAIRDERWEGIIQVRSVSYWAILDIRICVSIGSSHIVLSRIQVLNPVYWCCNCWEAFKNCTS